MTPLLLAQLITSQPAIVWNDGDSGVLPDGTEFRLFSMDAPETHRPKCERERRLGYKAEGLAIGFTYGKDLTWELVGHRTWNREAVRLYANGVDVGEWLVENGPAEEWRHRPEGGAIGPRPSWC